MCKVLKIVKSKIELCAAMEIFPLSCVIQKPPTTVAAEPLKCGSCDGDWIFYAILNHFHLNSICYIEMHRTVMAGGGRARHTILSTGKVVL
jgi:hypothetical protein